MSAAEILAATEPETDPDREGVRLLLAAAVSLLPSSLSLDELVTVAVHLFPQLRPFDPAVVADVARRLRAA